MRSQFREPAVDGLPVLSRIPFAASPFRKMTVDKYPLKKPCCAITDGIVTNASVVTTSLVVTTTEGVSLSASLPVCPAIAWVVTTALVVIG